MEVSALADLLGVDADSLAGQIAGCEDRSSPIPQEFRIAADAVTAATDREDLLRRLCLACEQGNPAVVRLLLEVRAEPNACNTRGHSPLFIAAGKGFNDVLEALVAGGARCEIVNTDGSELTPLHAAARRGEGPNARRLLAGGAHPHARARFRKPVLQGAPACWLTALHLACLYGGSAVVSEILEHFTARPGAVGGPPGRHPAQPLLCAGSEIGTALHCAAYVDDLASSRLLVDAGGAELIESDTFVSPTQFLPLMGFGGQKHEVDEATGEPRASNVVTCTLKRGTPLLAALISSGRRVVRAGAPRLEGQAAPRGGSAALKAAGDESQLGVARLLLDRGANPNAACTILFDRDEREGSVPLLYLCCMGGLRRAVELLLARGADIDGDRGKRACEVAESQGHLDIAKLVSGAMGARIEAADAAMASLLREIEGESFVEAEAGGAGGASGRARSSRSKSKKKEKGKKKRGTAGAGPEPEAEPTPAAEPPRDARAAASVALEAPARAAVDAEEEQEQELMVMRSLLARRGVRRRMPHPEEDPAPEEGTDAAAHTEGGFLTPAAVANAAAAAAAGEAAAAAAAA